MDQPIYVRVRGKTQGPYTVEQLQSLASRGQFSRLHEVSMDGVEWKRAATIPELFANAVPHNRLHRDEFDGAGSTSATGGEYFVRARGRAFGPYTVDYLRSLARKGQLTRSHEISTDGVSWMRASTVASLFSSKRMAPPGDELTFVDETPRAKNVAPTQELDQPPEDEPGVQIYDRLDDGAAWPLEPQHVELDSASFPWSWVLLAVLVAISIAAAAVAILAVQRPDLLIFRQPKTPLSAPIDEVRWRARTMAVATDVHWRLESDACQLRTTYLPRSTRR